MTIIIYIMIDIKSSVLRENKGNKRDEKFRILSNSKDGALCLKNS